MIIHSGRKVLMKRRSFLKGAGIVSVLAGGGLVWRAGSTGVFSTGKGPAYEPWKNWRSDKAEGPLGLVRTAILAASPHNTQPWLFHIDGSTIDLFADLERNIGAIDSDLREMYIGVGCALENLLLAARAGGYSFQLSITPYPSNKTLAARIQLSPGPAAVSDLYEAIPHRHTNRGSHKTEQRISSEAIKAMGSLADDLPDTTVIWLQGERGRKFADYNVQATEALIADREQSESSYRWARMAWKDLQKYRDGVTIDAMPIPAAVRALSKMLPPMSGETGDKYFLKAMQKLYDNTDTFGIIAVRNSRDRAQRIQGGRLWQRMHLWGTTKGLGMGPVNITAERADREAALGLKPKFGNALKDLVQDSGWQALMPFRVGYPTMEALASPRRAVKDVLV
jgi:hypothetical protein